MKLGHCVHCGVAWSFSWPRKSSYSEFLAGHAGRPAGALRRGTFLYRRRKLYRFWHPRTTQLRLNLDHRFRSDLARWLIMVMVEAEEFGW